MRYIVFEFTFHLLICCNKPGAQVNKLGPGPDSQNHRLKLALFLNNGLLFSTIRRTHPNLGGLY